ncbi:MAG: substrate-binding periplasmic protein [Sutterella sp.]
MTLKPLAAALVLAAAVFCPITAAASEPYIVAVESDYYPFSFHNEKGELTGFDVDMANSLCRRLKSECRIVERPLAAILDGLARREFAFAVAGLRTMPERERFMAFSDVYYRSRSFFISKTPGVGSYTFDKADGLRIGVQRNTIQYEYLIQNYLPRGARIRAYDRWNDVKAAIRAGEVSVILSDGLPGYAFLKSQEGRGLFIAGNAEDDPLATNEARIAAPESDRRMIARINQALRAMKAEGEIQLHSLRYFSHINF